MEETVSPEGGSVLALHPSTAVLPRLGRPLLVLSRIPLKSLLLVFGPAGWDTGSALSRPAGWRPGPALAAAPTVFSGPVC